MLSLTELLALGGGGENRTLAVRVKAACSSFELHPQRLLVLSDGIKPSSRPYQRRVVIIGPREHGGTGRSRTVDLLLFRQALSQLSYGTKAGCFRCNLQNRR